MSTVYPYNHNGYAYMYIYLELQPIGCGRTRPGSGGSVYRRTPDDFRIEVLGDVLARFGRLGIFNTACIRQNEVAISRHGGHERKFSPRRGPEDCPRQADTRNVEPTCRPGAWTASPFCGRSGGHPPRTCRRRWRGTAVFPYGHCQYGRRHPQAPRCRGARRYR